MNLQTLIDLLQTEYLTSRGSFNGKKALPDHIEQSIRAHTNFLNYDASITVRVSYILKRQSEQLRCVACMKPLEIKVSIPRASRYCSVKCSHSSIEVKEKRKKTSIKRYGVDNPSKSNQVKQAIQETSLERYGVDNPSKSNQARARISSANKQNAQQRMAAAADTVMRRYGVDHISQLDSVKDKKQQTFENNYGVDHFFKTPEFKHKMHQQWQERYGVDNPSKSNQVKQKIKETKRKRYGDSAYNNREQANCTMNDKYGTHSSRRHWSTSTTKVMQSKDLLSNVAKNKTVNNIADLYGIAPTTVRSAFSRYNINNYISRKNQYEAFVQDILDNAGILYHHNSRKELNGLEIDFLIPDCSLGIELNGHFWHSELMGKDRNYHLNKTKQAQEQGLQLIHVWDFQIDKNPDLIKSMILHRLGRAEITVYARNTSITELSPSAYRRFLDDNHIQGSMNSKYKYGLVFNNNLVAVMGFGNSRFNRNTVELHRFCVAQNYSVVGGASKLFNHFLKMNTSVTTVESFALRDVSNGTLYTKLGFKKISETPPNYFYFKSRVVYNRLQFQKHKLVKKLENFDNSLTEWENMKNHGYNRFWDTGSIKYVYTRTDV